VSAAVTLKGRSPNFLGLCPFHQEKTPSFHVRDNVGRFKCFGCGASGDVFEFLMRLRGIQFSEAMLELSKQAGLYEEPRIKSPSEKKEAKDPRFAQAMAQEFFVEQLKGFVPAMDYLQKQRGLSVKMIKQAGIGFGGVSREAFLAHLKTRKVPEQLAIEAGLLKQGQFSRISPFFSRITFPIRDGDENIIAFGGRAFLNTDNTTAKHVNTHSYQHYEKRKTFYGWHESKAAMLKGVTPVLVEGYFDAMAMWALGYPALALCGTSLTKEHVTTLKRQSSRLLICFDTDAAGIQALRHALEELFRANISPNLVLLKEKDPGAYLEKKNLEALRQCVETPIDALCFLIDEASATAAGSVAERMHQLDLLLPIFSSIHRPLLRRQYVAYFAKRFLEEPAMLWAEIEKKIKPSMRRKTEAISQDPLNPQERLLLQIALSAPSLIPTMTPNLLHASSDMQKIFQGLAPFIVDKEQKSELDDAGIEALVKGINRQIWPQIKEVIDNRVDFSDDEAKASLIAMKDQLEKRKRQETLRKKRSQLRDLEKKGDFIGVLSTLKEQSLLRLAKPRQEKSEKPQEKKLSSSKESSLDQKRKAKNIEDLDGDSFFDTGEDWQ
jgi:DNA primase